eukprot:scaffold23658_cov61-Phaeocystis_antarctica.AAC.15
MAATLAASGSTAMTKRSSCSVARNAVSAPSLAPASTIAPVPTRPKRARRHGGRRSSQLFRRADRDRFTRGMTQHSCRSRVQVLLRSPQRPHSGGQQAPRRTASGSGSAQPANMEVFRFHPGAVSGGAAAGGGGELAMTPRPRIAPARSTRTTTSRLDLNIDDWTQTHT